jgi:integrase
LSGNKIGSVYYDNTKNRWVVAYYVFDKNTNKEIRKRKVVKTEEEGKQFLSSLQYQKGNEIFIENNGIPLGQLMRSNIQRKLDMNLITETQYARVLKTIQVIEKNDICKRKIEDITSDDIQNYINTLKDYSNSYIKKIMEQFNQSYRLAINKGYISKNPMVDVIKPRSTKPDKEVRAMTIEEQQTFTNYLMSKTIQEEPYKNVFLIQMYMGLRISEVLALRSSDINLKWNLLKVNKTLTTDKNGKTIMGDTTKTYAGIRDVPIPKFIRDSIIEQMKLAENQRDHQLFISPNNSYVDSRNTNRILKKRLLDLGITGISTHSLRHTYGTRCVEAGMRAVALQRLMGHKDVSVTLNTYTSVFNKYKESELEKVNDYYMNNDIVNQNQKFLNKNDDVKEDNSVIEKRKILKEIIKMLENDVIKGLLPISEYQENIEYLKKKYKFLYEEENGDDER